MRSLFKLFLASFAVLAIACTDDPAEELKDIVTKPGFSNSLILSSSDTSATPSEGFSFTTTGA